ncbi:Uncharacterized conserved protein YehS, DUF1456 family [Marinobacter sp. LV10R510-11A]|uniref:DUF1456 family protein n=1 Tax=Marinobacter sp. LV10R510-11A TaxID=1415568 RepID=UPI000BB89351|nr:DUF1456 family protein [Marinobacter sp. LV10R510-11A]SOB78157.1 Uncharacterized conserved protein YehS, DUF1456 family [Marinobacter sp. LV10R510-11A]
MTNNDVLRRIRYAFDLKDPTMVEVFSLADFSATEEQVSAWLKKEEDDAFLKLNDTELAAFLNGFINFKRGKRDGQLPKTEESLNNNMVFQKLRIALDLKADDILDIFKLIDFRLSKHELSAFFRKPGSNNYRECKDQILRNFLLGLQCKLRPNHNASDFNKPGD